MYSRTRIEKLIDQVKKLEASSTVEKVEALEKTVKELEAKNIELINKNLLLEAKINSIQSDLEKISTIKIAEK